jgi:hypothetical protein
MTPHEFDVAPVLTVGQISRSAGIKDNRRTLRLLCGAGVKILKIGRWHVVERLALRDALPSFYEALASRVSSVDG